MVILYTLAQRQAHAPTAPMVRHSAQVHLNESSMTGAVTVRPLTVMEDSRCPRGVQCIQAGTVKVQTQIISAMGPSVMIFELGKPITTEAEEVTLTDVSPAPQAGVTVAPKDYVFTFEIKQRAR